MEEKTKSINLLQQKSNSLLNQFLNWALTIGRLLIILTETLALSVFIYRFSLDMKIIDLHDKIKHQSAIVKQFENSENTFRDIHARLALVQKNDSTNVMPANILSDIIEMGRGHVTFKELTVSTKSITFDIQTTSSNSLSFFIKKLKTYPNLTDVKIESIENKTTSAVIIVGISAKIKTI